MSPSALSTPLRIHTDELLTISYRSSLKTDIKSILSALGGAGITSVANPISSAPSAYPLQYPPQAGIHPTNTAWSAAGLYPSYPPISHLLNVDSAFPDQPTQFHNHRRLPSIEAPNSSPQYQESRPQSCSRPNLSGPWFGSLVSAASSSSSSLARPYRQTASGGAGFALNANESSYSQERGEPTSGVPTAQTIDDMQRRYGSSASGSTPGASEIEIEKARAAGRERERTQRGEDGYQECEAEEDRFPHLPGYIPPSTHQ